MRDALRPLLGLVAAALVAAPAARADESTPAPAAPNVPGRGPGYDALGDLPVQHVEGQGSRIKPLDTLARQTIKAIYGRETIRLPEGLSARTLKDHFGLDRSKIDWKRQADLPARAGDPARNWTAPGAFVDWQVNGAYWDTREILLIDLFDYRPFKQELLAEPIRETLHAAAKADGTAAADRERIEAILGLEQFSERDLQSLLAATQLPTAERAAVALWAEKLGDGRKWVAPADLAAAVVRFDGHEHTFPDWFEETRERAMLARQQGTKFEPTEVEQKAMDLGQKLARYEALRDRNPGELPVADVLVVPRPHDEAYLRYTGSLIKGVIAAPDGREFIRSMTPLDRDTLATLNRYLDDIRSAELYMADVREGRQKPPGEDPKFDRNFSRWLAQSSAWVPLRVILVEDLDKLAAAGFPRERVEEFRSAHSELLSAARSAPGALPEAPAAALVASARELGQETNAEFYPTPAAMALETHFNRFAPFSWAPVAYGAGLVLLLISLGIHARPGSTVATLDSGIYWAGMAAFVGGIALEAYGFYLRVVISGWAPVTNMYETVIWVAAIAAVLGLIFELIYRRKVVAVAATGMALLGTLLAANVPLLESDISHLPPVLRDNYWLTVHVLTIVSSYAAFTLALGLGLLGVAYYLSATYRRDVGYVEAVSPLLAGLPLTLGANYALFFAMPQGAIPSTGAVLGLVGSVGLIGWGLVVMGLFALLGEYANRHSRSALVLGIAVTLLGAGAVGMSARMSPPTGWPEQVPLTFQPGLITVAGLALVVMASLGARSRRIYEEAQALSGPELSSAGGAPTEDGPSATVGAKPSVAEIRARSAASRPKLDARGQAMQYVASQVKPLSNFIYRAMQVGVLLVAAGTILGGVWADVSWGRFWGWDPKEVWALITLLVYLVPLHGRFAGWVSSFGMIKASVFCYMSVLMAWYGVNFVLGVGLHSYGFTEGGGQGVVFASAVAMIGVTAGAAWRRHLGTRDLAA